MEKPKISIIIPIYNTEAYLPRCLDSILAQTYQNLQIILVDDGSTDGCGTMCDAYAKKDTRIEVIHQPNSGVAAARNAGLAVAYGEWIGWVDSDDWIEPDMFDCLLENALGSQADICICGRYEELPRRTAFFGWPERTVLEQKAAMKALLEDRHIDNALYDKLWKRELFDGIRFPEGRTYEDLATVYRLFDRVTKVLCLPQPKYHYRRRRDSITGNVSLHNRMNHYISACQRYADMVTQWSEYEPLLEQQCMTAAVGLWSGYCCAPRNVRLQYKPQLREISQRAKSRIRQNLRHTGSGLAGRMVMRLLPYDDWWAFALAGLVGWLYKWKNGRTL